MFGLFLKMLHSFLCVTQLLWSVSAQLRC